MADPAPVIGWDSLKSLIKYPEVAQRSGLDGFADVSITIDSVGEINNVQIYSSQQLFDAPIREALYKTKWIPAKYQWKYINGQVSFPIHFILKGILGDHRLIIEVNPFKERKK